MHANTEALHTSPTVLRHYDLPALLGTLAMQLAEYIRQHALVNPLMVGVQRSGVWLARDLYQRLALDGELGELNISFYRDDLSRNGLPAQIEPSRLPLSVEDRHVILIDDIIGTGRTVRAALNELFDYGRPASVTLAVLVARGNRELPIEPQVCVLREEPGPDQVYLISPDPLRMELILK